MGNDRKKKKDEDKKKALKRRRAHSTAHPPSDGPVVLFEPRGEVKMSAVMLDFIKPYEQVWETEDELRKLVVVAIVAWNAAIAPDDKGEALVQSTMATFPPEAQVDFLSIVVALVERKQRFFASNTRLIVDYNLTLTRDGPHLLIMSTLPT